MKPAEINAMIENDSFGPEFNLHMQNKITEMYKVGKVREAQQLVNEILDNPRTPKCKTLL